jgi:hypothetical protein
MVYVYEDLVARAPSTESRVSSFSRCNIVLGVGFDRRLRFGSTVAPGEAPLLSRCAKNVLVLSISSWTSSAPTEATTCNLLKRY